MGIFSNNKKFKAVELDDNYQAFSTPFQKLPNGNLSLPLVWDRYTSRGFIYFGDDNLYPNYLDQVYFSSPLHGSIVKFKSNAAVGGGHEIILKDPNVKNKVALYGFEKRLNLDKLVPHLTIENIVHERNYFLGHVKGGVVKKFEHIAASKVRVNKDKSLYTVADDWTNQTSLKSYPVYHKGCKDGIYMIAFEGHSLGQDYYPLPQYTSALNYAFLSGEMSYLAKSNIQNSVFASVIFKFPKKPQGREELQDIKNTIEKAKGAENAGKTLAFFANTKDQLPEADVMPTNPNEGLFREASELVTEQICFAHTIDPILLGVRTTGSLGNGSDIKQAYVIFEKNVIIPLRQRIEDIINTLLKLSDIEGKIEITNYQIINETIIEVEEEGSATSDALNAMSPLVATKVLESMTQNEIRSLAGLGAVEGGDIQRGAESAPQSTGEGLELNDNLRGLSAQENMDIIRIVRDYNKGKLNKVLSSARLAAYGLSAEMIEQILSE